jgi:hypothetical protein
MNHHIGNVPLNKNLSWLCPSNFVGRYTAIATANPQKIGSLNMLKIAKKQRILSYHFFSPLFIIS